MDKVQFFQHSNGEKTAYRTQDGDGIGVFCLGGHRSTMDRPRYGRYAEMFAPDRISFTCFDWQGFGQSSGSPNVEGLIRDWAAQALDIFDNCTTGKQIIMGISMGGWLMYLLAMLRPERVAGLVGVCSGFGVGLYSKSLAHYDLTRVCLDNKSCGFDFDNADGTYTRVVSKIPGILCPVRLYHSYTDEKVNWKSAQSALDNLPEDCDAKLIYTRSGNHSMSRDEDYQTILALVQELRQK